MMFETENLGLPLVQAAQAQKHVTVNEGLVRLDGVVQLVLEAIDVVTPPTVPFGAFSIGAGAVGAWAGRDGQIALAVNGGWDFIIPGTGWRAWVADESSAAIFDGARWRVGAVTVSPAGAGMVFRTVEVDHLIQAGPGSTTVPIIPAQSVVYGVTGRVLAEIVGDATSFSLGVAAESPDRYGSGYGLQAGAWMQGLTSSPLTYYADTALTLTAAGGSFGSGQVRLSVHLAELALPSV